MQPPTHPKPIRQKRMKKPKDTFLFLSSPNSPKQSHIQCTLLLIATHKTQCLSCSAAQHITFSVNILYEMYSLQLNCTYSNYTEAAATCSAAQQHSTFTVQILYKLYSLQLKCTYRIYTEAAAAATYSAAKNTQTLQLMSSEVQFTRLF